MMTGEVWLILDDEEVCLKAGDVCVQRGTIHAWSNRTPEPCLIAVVLLDADPLD
jgi:quercetin dioxygenase-like cupin family protein